ncbi:MAG: FAD-dependent oxidoreductase [Bacillota bacterium]|nr:FAD-dependent oxidoreductase [Bacillota bacterium]
MEKIVVVGSNHAGTAFINTVLDHSKDKQVVVFDANSNISFLGCGMALWIGGQIRGSEGLFYSNKDKLTEKGANIHIETEVKNIDFDKKIVYAEGKNGEKYEETYDKLVFATGSLPIIPPIAGIELENVQRVKLFQDAAAVIKKLENPDIKDVVVVGAGYIGVELAEAFKRHGKNTTLIDIAETCLPTYYDPEFTSMMRDNLAKNGVKLAFGEAVKAIEGDGKVERVVTDKGVHKADMVVMAIGFRPNCALGKDRLETFRNGAYVVNKRQETSEKDVYAIGDCATVYDNAINDKNYIALASNAVRSGLVAAFNILGKDIESVGVQGSNGICIFDLKMVSTGITYTRAKNMGIDAEYTDFEDLQKATFMEDDNYRVKIRIVYDKKSRVIIGAQIASLHDVSLLIHMFSLAIQEKVTIDKLALTDLFFLPHFNQPYNYVTMAALTAK